MPYSPQTWTNGVSKLNATRMGVIETGIQTAQAAAEAAIAKSLVDAKGDLIVGTAADTAARLAVGTNNFALVADSAQTGGMKWAQITNAMVDPAAAIAYSKLSLSGAIVNADISASAAIARSKIAPIGYGTSLPGSPANGDEYVLVDSTTAPTYQWRFRYNSSRSTDKWEFIGGAPIVKQVNTAEALSTTGSYQALTTAGPSFTLPVAGSYIVAQGFRLSASTVGSELWMSYDIGGTGAVDADATRSTASGIPGQPSVSRTQLKSGLTAVALVSKYKIDTATQTFEHRWLSVTPVAVGG